MPTGVYKRYESLGAYLDAHSEQVSNGCVEWRGSRTKGGYGTCGYAGNKTTAHRAAYGLRHGGVAPGLEIDHLCRNTLCINPDHLEAVTQIDHARRSLKAAQTHCNHGHEYTPENTYLKPSNGCRSCRKCNARRSRELRRLVSLQRLSPTPTTKETS